MADVPLRVDTQSLLDQARQVLAQEADALADVAARLDDHFIRMVEFCAACTGRLAITGVGKSADVGGKIAGTLNSTGSRAYVLDATKAMHGDLGMVHPDDVAILLSHSGESDEVIRLLGPLSELAAGVLGITGNPNGTLARRADLAFVYGPVAEACPLALAPSTSTTVMLALGDALAFSLLTLRQFTSEDFAKYHPSGSLGRKLAHVEQIMRHGAELRFARVTDPVRSVFAKRNAHGRRTGAIMIADQTGRLVGIFTDSDLARLFELHREHLLDCPIRDVMTPDPKSIPAGAKVLEALELLQRHKISELPVVDSLGRAVGMVDITDLIGLTLAPPQPLGIVRPPEPWHKAAS